MTRQSFTEEEAEIANSIGTPQQGQWKATVCAARLRTIEECAAILDGAAAAYFEYANKYQDVDGDRAALQGRTCRQMAESIRQLASGREMT